MCVYRCICYVCVCVCVGVCVGVCVSVGVCVCTGKKIGSRLVIAFLDCGPDMTGVTLRPEQPVSPWKGATLLQVVG